MRRRGPLDAVIVYSEAVALLHIRGRVLSFCPAAVSCIFLAIDRRHMRRIFNKIGSADPKVLPVCIDPFPQILNGDPSLRLCPALDAEDVGRKSLALAAAKASAMV